MIPPRHYIVTPGKRENIILYIYNVAKVYSSKDSSSVSFFLWKVLTGKHVLHKRIYKFWFRKPQTLWNSSDTFETAHWDFFTKSAVKVGGWHSLLTAINISQFYKVIYLMHHLLNVSKGSSFTYFNSPTWVEFLIQYNLRWMFTKISGTNINKKDTHNLVVLLQQAIWLSLL